MDDKLSMNYHIDHVTKKVQVKLNILRKFRRNISDITAITPKTPQIFHPMCSISTGFPQVPSNFPKTFESTFKFKLLPRSTCLSKRNHFISCACKTACYGLLYDILDSYMRLHLFWRVLFLKNVEKYGKTVVFLVGYSQIGEIPHGQLWQIGVYRVKNLQNLSFNPGFLQL